MNDTTGKVFLVGAGPGDHRLLTIKAAECLAAADTVVYDRLADSRILAHAKRAQEFIYVGKASAKHTMKQGDINQLLVDKAKEGKIVVRLKGGDPFVFGRGGEEALLLEKNDISFTIVPGITSAISVPAYAGIPVTHRAVATSFAVITGHEDPTKAESQMNWAGLATGVDTLIFLMGIANLPHITAKLIENGRAADTPAAVIRWGTKAEQETLVTTVGNAAEDVKKHGIKPPAIFLVGDVVNLREKLRWFDDPKAHPLIGKHILVTRARAQASALTEKLEALGACVKEVPAIAIEPPSDDYAALDAAVEKIDGYHWLIFTSVNGVQAFFRRLEKAGKDTRALGYAKIAAIGSATAAKLKEYGITADILPKAYRAEGILEALKGKLPPHAKILLPRAEKARAVLPDSLRKKGAVVDVVPAYRTVTAPLEDEELKALKEDLAAERYDFVTFTSSSTVKNFCKMLGGAAILSGVKTAAIGPVTAETMEKEGMKATVIAKTYTIEGLLHAILSTLTA